MKRTQLLWLLEGLWWILTAFVVLAVLYPIYQHMYLWVFRDLNIVFVVALITLSRYIFLLEHTFLAKRQYLKQALFFAMVPLVFYLVWRVNTFLRYVEDNTWEPVTGHLPALERKSVENYLWVEMIFFGVGSAFAGSVFAARLLISIWRTHNRGTA